MDRTTKRKLARLIALLLLTVCVVCGVIFTRDAKVHIVQKNTQHFVYDENQTEYMYDKNSPLIFVGGFPRSGTTLMRALLDAHPDVRCGEETRLIPNVLQSRLKWVKNRIDRERLEEAGVDDEVIKNAVAAFVLEIMARHGEPAKRLCDKDPFVLSSLSYMHGVFPKGKYILMIRDGRASVHSMITRHVTITGYNMSSYRECLGKWNHAIQGMYNQCLYEGPQVCLPVYYEQLVLHSEDWMRKILAFLDIPWDDGVLHHENTVGKPGGISLSKTEKSTDQVIKPINKGALTSWVGHIPLDVAADIDTIAPMLTRLGYDAHAVYPNYDKRRGDMNLWDPGWADVEKQHKISLQDLYRRKVIIPKEVGTETAQLGHK